MVTDRVLELTHERFAKTKQKIAEYVARNYNNAGDFFCTGMIDLKLPDVEEPDDPDVSNQLPGIRNVENEKERLAMRRKRRQESATKTKCLRCSSGSARRRSEIEWNPMKNGSQ